MRIISSANGNFRQMCRNLMCSATSLGYPFHAYDLGDLGFGEPLQVGEVKTTCMHKPAIVRESLESGDPVAYLDSDTLMLDRIDEIGGDYDVGITVRRPTESKLASKLSYINAGVLFFPRYNKKFHDLWAVETAAKKDDQLGLSAIINPGNEPIPCNTTLYVKGFKIQTFPTDIYNFYYFKEPLGKAKILHFKSDIRDNYRYYGVLL